MSEKKGSSRSQPCGAPKSAATEAEGSAAVTGTLRNVWFTPCGHGAQRRVAHGAIFGDTRRRFANGDEVCTSWLESGPDAGGLIRTRNSVYRIESYQPGAGPDDFNVQKSPPIGSAERSEPKTGNSGMNNHSLR